MLKIVEIKKFEEMFGNSRVERFNRSLCSVSRGKTVEIVQLILEI